MVMSRKSTFGAEPEQLKRLLTAIGLEKSSAGEQSNQTASSPSTGKLAGRIGRYKLLSVLGEGGMGVVYLAEQERPIRRQVALKVIKPGMDSARVIARFEAERQALALLDHPNIAHVHDAGTTENGRPYFVMEYVQGLPITKHCNNHKLTIENRLNLFRQVCLAVHHAHQKGIIHRDIKPSNILISTQDNQAVPKIIDFGVAKALSMPLTERTLTTEDSQLLGTPEYMSPEQADRVSEDIDTRSDIYSLGVLLYVLLTGVLPFDSDTLRTGGIDHIRQIIRETDPKTPSTRLLSLGEEAKKIAQSRRTEIATLAKKLHKELEWIPLKAMRKERAERYRSASELADDIENYLKGVPLLAGPPSTMYQLKKFTGRHRALVTGLAAVLLVLGGGVAVSTLLAIGQARARAEAQTIGDFLRINVLEAVDPWAKGRETTFIEVLDALSENIESKLGALPLAEASIRYSLGRTYRHLGELKTAEQHFERALQISLEQHGQKHQFTLDMMNGLAFVYYFEGCYDKAEQLFARQMELSRQVSDEQHPDLPAGMSGLAIVYIAQGRYNEAELLLKTTRDHRIRILGKEHTWTLGTMNSLAVVYRNKGQYNKAEELLTRTLEIERRVLSEQHRFTLNTMQELAVLWREQSRYDQAEQLLVKVLQVRRSVRGEEHPYVLSSMNELAILYSDQARYRDAEALFADALDIGRRILGDDHPDTLVSMNGLAVLHRKQKQYDQAEQLFAKAIEGRHSRLGEDHPATLESKHDLAMLYKEQGDYDKAEPLLLEAVEGRRLKLGDTHPHTIESWNNLIDLYEAWNKSEKAKEWRAKLSQIETVD
jgi:serine/threonine protein kinase/Tfp pilus assembly protein PilF